MKWRIWYEAHGEAVSVDASQFTLPKDAFGRLLKAKKVDGTILLIPLQRVVLIEEVDE